jgi:hypothetical protein
MKGTILHVRARKTMLVMAAPSCYAMPMTRFLTLVGFFALSVCGAIAAEAPYRHIVLFKFKDDAPAAEIVKVEKAFAALKSRIDVIQDYEWGTNVSPEGKADGFTHCFFVTFKNKAGLEAYLPHPEHKKFVAGLKGLIDKVLVVDYVAKGVE